MPLKNKNQSKPFNIICFLCDSSISHILSHSFSNISQSFISFNTTLSNTLNVSHKTISIIDNDLSKEEKNIFFKWHQMASIGPSITVVSVCFLAFCLLFPLVLIKSFRFWVSFDLHPPALLLPSSPIFLREHDLQRVNPNPNPNQPQKALQLTKA